MNRNLSLFARWHNMLAFWSGSIMVTVGVALHLPIFLLGRKTGFRLAGMPMDRACFWAWS
jgi:MFS transporter, putative metabolite:H+ symporter